MNNKKGMTTVPFLISMLLVLLSSWMISFGTSFIFSIILLSLLLVSLTFCFVGGLKAEDKLTKLTNVIFSAVMILPTIALIVLVIIYKASIFGA